MIQALLAYPTPPATQQHVCNTKIEEHQYPLNDATLHGEGRAQDLLCAV